MGSQRTKFNAPHMTRALAGLSLGLAVARPLDRRPDRMGRPATAPSAEISPKTGGGTPSGFCKADDTRGAACAAVKSSGPTAAKATALALATAAFTWAYWPTLLELVKTWAREPDYSHGFFVAPLAAFFLWVRRDRCPDVSRTLAWGGLSLILLSAAARYLGALWYVDSIDAWSIPIWTAGAVWLFWGRRVAWWAAPSAAFLWFMAPLPWRVERWLSLPLQGIATTLSTWTLQGLAQPAMAEGHTILLDDYRLEIVDACSGLRVFVGIFALAFAYVLYVRRTWWERAILLLSALPVALAANAARIVVTGLLYRYVSGEAAHRFSHDVSGWFSIPFAALLFAGVLWYLDRLFRIRESAAARRRPAPGRSGGRLADEAGLGRRMVNVPLLLGTLFAGAVVVPAAHAWHDAQVQRTAQTLLQQAQAFQREHQWEQAADYFHRCVKLQPSDVHARIGLARAYDRLAGDSGRQERAVELYAEAVHAASGLVEHDELAALRARHAELLSGRQASTGPEPPPANLQRTNSSPETP